MATSKTTAPTSTPRKRAATKSTTTNAQQSTTTTTIKPQDEQRTPTELIETLRGYAANNAKAIETAAKRLQTSEAKLAADGVDAHNPAEAGAAKAHRDRDAAMLKLIELDAGWTFIARVRSVPASTNRGLCRVLMGDKRI